MNPKNIVRLFFISITVFIWFACAPYTSGSFFKKGTTETLTGIRDNHFKPRFSPDGEKLLFTDIRNSTLSIYDLQGKKITEVSSEQNAGQQAGFTPENEFIYYITQDPSEKIRLKSLVFHNLKTGSQFVVAGPSRELNVLEGAAKGTGSIIFLENGVVKQYDHTKKMVTDADSSTLRVFTDSDLNLAVYQNREIRVLNPKGKGNYIWVSTSPDQKRILFVVSGKGTYSCNLKGQEIIDYGRLHAPKWSPDGTFIVGMDDYDDGEKFIRSDVVLVSSDGTTREVLNPGSKIIGLYPEISRDQKKLAFNDEKGMIYVMNIK